jgi:hypothetical protein
MSALGGQTWAAQHFGQLLRSCRRADDLADFVAAQRPLHPNASFSLIGFSSGGGFALRVIDAHRVTIFARRISVGVVSLQVALGNLSREASSSLTAMVCEVQACRQRTIGGLPWSVSLVERQISMCSPRLKRLI